MTRLKASFGEGDVFAVPLDDGSFATALVARRSAGLIAFGYFFGPRHASVPTLAELGRLDPSDAALVRQFSALAIREGSWPRVGRIASWDRDRWPIPGFRSGSSLVSGPPIRIDYDDALSPIGERVVTPEEYAGLADDSTYGSRAVEMVLSHRLPGGRVGPESATITRPEAASAGPASPAAERPSLLDNDDAMDWLGSLVRSRSGALIEKALDAVLLTPGYLELPAGNAALAAAEVVASAAGSPAAALPAPVSAWAARHRAVATTVMLDKARRAIERVTGPDSELREVWSESASKTHWEHAVEDLGSRLDAGAAQAE